MLGCFEEKGLRLCHHDEDGRFVQQTSDVEWIGTLARDGEPAWIVISGDGRILKNRAERKALDEAGLLFFCLGKHWPSMAIHEFAWRFIKIWPGIVELSRTGKHRIYEVQSGGAMKIEPKG